MLSETFPQLSHGGKLSTMVTTGFTWKAEVLGNKNPSLRNTNEAHFDYISKRYDFLSLFDAHLLSFRLKKVKPEKEIYEAAIMASKTPREHCFYIDDIPEYVAAAKALGLEGHVYQNFPLFIETLKAEQVL